MEGVSVITKYFKNLDDLQLQRFTQLGALYATWNERVNLVSRKDIEHLYERHILHSLSIARFIKFKPDVKVMDLGTGGGFPGIPLAICFPEVQFTLIDSIAKKMRVVEDLVQVLGLKNVNTIVGRAENIKGSFDYVVSRAVAPLSEIYAWTGKSIAKKQQHAMPNGIICLKGGDLRDELMPFKNRVEVHEIHDWFDEEFFETKKLVYLPC
ncbi:MAG: 16S rRNA (guanine(527)-N(7))-methyltransferase RsmG [Bacteroidota bacterium]|jgi:16S rRNA (guanine527-N7)-methyltransferase